MALDRRPARELYADHASLERRYRRPILALVRRHTPRTSSAWIDREDYAQEAWATVYRVLSRYGHLQEPDFGNIVVTSTRNALINLARRGERDRTLQGTDIDALATQPAARDPYHDLLLRVTLQEVRATLRPPILAVLDTLIVVLLGDLLARGRVHMGDLSLALGCGRDTARVRLQELRRALHRALQ